MTTTLKDRLAAAGFDVHEVRGWPCLDGRRVDKIVAQVPIRFTRRRYGFVTYTWAEAYVAGWFPLGDPWRGISVPNAEIEAELETLRENAI